MGETLKERLDRLSKAATPGKCHQDLATIVFPDANPSDHEIDNVAFTIELWNAYRTGDLIPRDEITPQMAAEVLLAHHGKTGRREVYDACERRVKVYKFDAVLTAIKESKDG